MSTPPNAATSIIAALSRTKTKSLKLDDSLTVQIKCLSLGALEKLQEDLKLIKDEEDQLAQLMPILRAGVQGLEEVTREDMRAFLLDDLKLIADEVMNVGKSS